MEPSPKFHVYRVDCVDPCKELYMQTDIKEGKRGEKEGRGKGEDKKDTHTHTHTHTHKYAKRRLLSMACHSACIS